MVPSAVEKTLNAIRLPFGIINKGVNYALQVMTHQQACLYEIIILPQIPDNFLKKDFSKQAKIIGQAVADQAIATLFAEKITPAFSSIEYEKVGNFSYPINVTHAEEITITFLEIEEGTTSLYLRSWMNDILTLTNDGRVAFVEDQTPAIKDMIIAPQMKMGLPGLGFILCRGVRLKSIQPPNYDWSNGDIVRYDVTCSIDSCWMSLPV